MTCKDCIHYETCIHCNELLLGENYEMKDLTICSDFLGKSNIIKLPCKVGDMVYVIPSLTNFRLNVLHGYSDANRVYEQEVHSIQMWKSDEWCLWTCGRINLLLQGNYKKTWFLSKEEAEKALEKLANENKNN